MTVSVVEPIRPALAADPGAGGRAPWIDYLRAAVTILVVAHHCAMPYATWAFFNTNSPLASTSPVVDPERTALLDALIRLNDAFFMSLMFFIAGLFLVPSIARHGVWGFIRERLTRLGVPFAVGVAVLMPLAYYASWLQAGSESGFASYYDDLARAGFMVGPNWFLWLLLAFSLIGIPFHRLLQKPAVSVVLSRISTHGWILAAASALCAFAAYRVMLARYDPYEWTVLVTPPFAAQGSRIALYGFWFLAGVIAGRDGIRSGLLGPGGPLDRFTVRWLVCAAVATATLVAWPLLEARLGPPDATLPSFIWTGCQVVLVIAALSASCRWIVKRNAFMDQLARRAFCIYLLHYVFVTWTQFAVLSLAWPALLKFALSFAVSLVLSWYIAGRLLQWRVLARFL